MRSLIIVAVLTPSLLCEEPRPLPPETFKTFRDYLLELAISKEDWGQGRRHKAQIEELLRKENPDDESMLRLFGSALTMAVSKLPDPPEPKPGRGFNHPGHPALEHGMAWKFALPWFAKEIEKRAGVQVVTVNGKKEQIAKNGMRYLVMCMAKDPYRVLSGQTQGDLSSPYVKAMAAIDPTALELKKVADSVPPIVAHRGTRVFSSGFIRYLGFCLKLGKEADWPKFELYKMLLVACENYDPNAQVLKSNFGPQLDGQPLEQIYIVLARIEANDAKIIERLEKIAAGEIRPKKKMTALEQTKFKQNAEAIIKHLRSLDEENDDD